MKNIKKSWWLFVFGVLGIYTRSFAAAGSGGSIELPNPLGCDNVSCVVPKIINFILMLAAPLCAIMVLWGGFLLMTSEGDPEKVSTGRKTILYAGIGFVVILLANSVSGLLSNMF